MAISFDGMKIAVSFKRGYVVVLFINVA